MNTQLKDFLEIPYTELERLNLESKNEELKTLERVMKN